MTDERTQINIIASEHQKERWEEYVEESGEQYSGLSQLIRRSVEKEIGGSTPQTVESMPDNITEQLSGVTESLNRVEARINDLDNRLASVEKGVREDPDITKLSNRVFEALPTEGLLLDNVKGADLTDQISHTGKIDDIATHLGIEPYRIEQAIEKLQEDTHQVHEFDPAEEIEGWQEVESDSEIRYFKER